MRKRCENRALPEYPSYGGRGIRVCDRWLVFENFIADMGEPPAGAQIDRIDNNGDYEPSNCRWATPPEQARNRRSNILITINGETKCLLDWTLARRLNYDTVRARIMKLGWEPERALSTPIAPCPRGRSSTSATSGRQQPIPT
jgi:hypothetical protein